MGPNFTPLLVPRSPVTPPKRKKSIPGNMFALIAVVVLMIGIVGGYVALSTGLFYKSRATGSSSPPACPAGTQLLFNTPTSNLNVGSTVNFGGKVTEIKREGSNIWVVVPRAGQLLAVGKGEFGPSKVHTMTVEFPTQVKLEYAVIYDNDPKTGEVAWKINGVSLQLTSNEVWAPLFKLNLTSNQMMFDNGLDSPQFNVCISTIAVTPTPSKTPTLTPTKTPTPTPNPICGQTCTSDAQCPTAHRCVDPNNMASPSSPDNKKCVLAKCTESGMVCDSTMCKVIPPTPTNACPKPNPVKNLRINCPICKGS